MNSDNTTKFPKGIIFDLDGVLIDTEHLQWKIWENTLKELGVCFPEEKWGTYSGGSPTTNAKILIEEYQLGIDSDVLLEKRKELFDKFLRFKNLRLMPYALECIQFFVNRGVEISLASSSSREELKLKLKGSGLKEEYFKVIVSEDDVDDGKPSPDIYIKAIEKLDLRPNDCIAIEDTQPGVESAKAASIPCFAVPTSYSKQQDFSNALKVFNNLNEVVKWMGGKR